MNWGILETIYLVISFIVGFVITLLIVPNIIRIMKRKGHTGIDIHKTLENGSPGIWWDFYYHWYINYCYTTDYIFSGFL